MSRSFSMKSAATWLAAAAFCAALAGCASDTGSSLPGAAQQSGNSPAMRYYGGPKYPMWSSQ